MLGSGEENSSSNGTTARKNKPYHHDHSNVAVNEYEGVVRSAQMIAAGQNRSRHYSTVRASTVINTSSKKGVFANQSAGTSSSSSNYNLTHVHLSEEEAIVQAASETVNNNQQQAPHAPAQPSPTSSSNSFGQLRSPSSNSLSESSQPLLIAISIGCALLLLNVVVCSALYRQCRLNRRLLTEQTPTSSNSSEKTKSVTSGGSCKQSNNCSSSSKCDGKRTLSRSPLMSSTHTLGPSVSLLGSGNTISRRNHHNPHHQQQAQSSSSMFPMESLQAKGGTSTGCSPADTPPQLLMLNSTHTDPSTGATTHHWTSTGPTGVPTFLSSAHNNAPPVDANQTYFCLVPDGPTNTFI